MVLKKFILVRICIGRVGIRCKIIDYLRFRVDYVVVQDVVWLYVDEKVVDDLGFVKVQILVKDKEEYIIRLDLGRCFFDKVINDIK